MKASLLLLVAVALLRRHVNVTPVISLANNAVVFYCHSGETSVVAEAANQVWRSVLVLAYSSTFSGWCTVSLNPRPPIKRPQQLLMLVRIECLQLKASDGYFYVTTSNPFRQSASFCTPLDGGTSYLWVNESVRLNLYRYFYYPQQKYNASFILAKATNVCDLASESEELLLVHESEYAFAPDYRHAAIPPNNRRCSANLEYFLTMRPYVSSEFVFVKVLACPSKDSCATLLLNDRLCREGETLFARLPFSSVNLSYVLHRECDVSKFAGFVVSAQTVASAKNGSSWIPSPTSGSRSLTSASLSSSSAPVSTAGSRGLQQSEAMDVSTPTVVAASIASLTIAALAIGTTTAIIRRRRHRLQSAAGQSPTLGTLYQVQNPTSTADSEIVMVNNDLYGMALARSSTENT